MRRCDEGRLHFSIPFLRNVRAVSEAGDDHRLERERKDEGCRAFAKRVRARGETEQW